MPITLKSNVFTLLFYEEEETSATTAAHISESFTSRFSEIGRALNPMRLLRSGSGLVGPNSEGGAQATWVSWRHLLAPRATGLALGSGRCWSGALWFGGRKCTRGSLWPGGGALCGCAALGVLLLRLCRTEWVRQAEPDWASSPRWEAGAERALRVGLLCVRGAEVSGEGWPGEGCGQAADRGTPGVMAGEEVAIGGGGVG